MTEVCHALQAEMALDLLEGELAAELPAHMRAFARAYADARPPPGAPLVARLASTLRTARDACAHDVLADRGLALYRLVAPLLIEDDPVVTALRAQPRTWPGLAALAEARDAVARLKLGAGAIEVLHRLHGVTAELSEHAQPGPPINGWQVPGPDLDQTAIADVWQAIAARLGLTGNVRNVRIDRSGDAWPRTFVIEPQIEVVIVVPAKLDTPAAQFAVLHELGHAVAALALPAGIPRVLDEAVASYVARYAELPSWLPPRWSSELAAPARDRRIAIAALLDRVERALPELPAPIDLPAPTPPWALWHDPGAQASYVAAEAIADRLRNDLGGNPPRGQLVRALTAERDRIDRRCDLRLL